MGKERVEMLRILQHASGIEGGRDGGRKGERREGKKREGDYSKPKVI